MSRFDCVRITAGLMILAVLLMLSGCTMAPELVVGKHYPPFPQAAGRLLNKSLTVGQPLYMMFNIEHYSRQVALVQNGRVAAVIHLEADAEVIGEPGTHWASISGDLQGLYEVHVFVLSDEWKEATIGSILINPLSYMGEPVAEGEDTFVVHGYSDMKSCDPVGCERNLQTPFGQKIMYVAERNGEITWLTDNITENSSMVEIVWRGAMFGNGYIEWLLNGKQVIGTNAVSYDREYSEGDVTLNYTYLGSDYGIFRLKVPRNMTIPGKNAITAQMLGEDFVAVVNDLEDDLVFHRSGTASESFGVAELTYCEMDCDVIYGSAWGPARGFFVSTGHASWNPNSFSTDKEYVVFAFRVTQLGSGSFQILLNDEVILTLDVAKEDREWIQNGYKADFDLIGYDEGYSGLLRIWVPSSKVSNRAELSIFPRNAWIFIQTTTPETANLIGDGSTTAQRGIDKITECQDYCNVSYPTLDGEAASYGVYKDGELAWKLPEPLFGNSSYVTYIWQGAHYGGGRVSYYLNGEHLIDIHAQERSETWVNEWAIAEFQYKGYMAGYQGTYRLWIPRLKLTGNDVLSVKTGNCWYLVRP